MDIFCISNKAWLKRSFLLPHLRLKYQNPIKVILPIHWFTSVAKLEKFLPHGIILPGFMTVRRQMSELDETIKRNTGSYLMIYDRE